MREVLPLSENNGLGFCFGVSALSLIDRNTEVVELVAKWGVGTGAGGRGREAGGTKEGIEMVLRFASARRRFTVAGVEDLEVVNGGLAGVDAALGVFIGAGVADFEGVGAVLFFEFPF